MSDTDRILSDENPIEIDVLPNDYTEFQLSLLAILADSKKYGLEIKQHLETYHEAEINHGRLYPNLDTLAEDGLITKEELDKRTNAYGLTESGAELLEAYVGWLAAYMDLEITGVTDE